MQSRFALTLATAALLSAAGYAHALTLDFDTDAQGNPILAGQFIDEEYADWGVHITAKNYNRCFDAAIAFDTLHPTGGDYDLRTDRWRYGKNNNEELGNVLILAENIRDRNRDGYVDRPDDEGGRHAGYFDFLFDQTISSGSIVMLDVDNRCEPGSVEFFLDGELLIQSFDFAAIGDNSVQTLDWSGFNYDRMRVNLGGSGAVAQVDANANPVPEPVTAILVAGAVTSLTLRTTRRRRHEENTNEVNN